MAMKFLVLWQIDLGLLSQALVKAIARMPDYGSDLERRGKVIARYHVVGAHGGAWIYEVDSHEEFERLLATDSAKDRFDFSGKQDLYTA